MSKKLKDALRIMENDMLRIDAIGKKHYEIAQGLMGEVASLVKTLADVHGLLLKGHSVEAVRAIEICFADLDKGMGTWTERLDHMKEYKDESEKIGEEFRENYRGVGNP